MESFVKSKAAGIDGGEIGIILESFDLGKDGSDFFGAEDGRETSLGLSAEETENVPVTLEDVFVEEAYAAIADAHGIGGPVIKKDSGSGLEISVFA